MQAYAPLCDSRNPSIKVAIEAGNRAFYEKLGITQQIVREPMPLGGYGFRWAFYHHGKQIDSQQDIAEIIKNSRHTHC